MLKDPEEIKIIAKAKQVNVRDPNRSREHFDRIVNDFFGPYSFKGKIWLDLGPGQFDFGEIAKNRGAVVENIDIDPAVIELGCYKKLKTFEGNLKKFSEIGLQKQYYDGVFCKFSVNAFWFHDATDKLVQHIDSIGEVLNENGSAWIAPWNGIPKNADLSDVQIKNLLDVQKQAFSDQGFTSVDLSNKQAVFYGINGTVANNIVFTRNL